MDRNGMRGIKCFVIVLIGNYNWKNKEENGLCRKEMNSFKCEAVLST